MTTTKTNIQEKSFPPIQKRLMQFIQHQFNPGYNHYNVSQLIGDASTRQYYRYVTDSGGCYILAAYPEPFDPDDFAYKQIYDLFCEIRLPVPEIIEIDGDLGIVLQEDLGNVSLQKKLLKADSQEKLRLLRQAIDHIIVIQQKGSCAFRPESVGYALAFDEEKLLQELN
ncbi:MAG TPA: hypothetical protein VKZ59_10985, partial [Acidobacteriota bacterium]|nr:hypothetical protein [Acidobacteriota bacterium]